MSRNVSRMFRGVHNIWKLGHRASPSWIFSAIAFPKTGQAERYEAVPQACSRKTLPPCAGNATESEPILRQLLWLPYHPPSLLSCLLIANTL